MIAPLKYGLLLLPTIIASTATGVYIAANWNTPVNIPDPNQARLVVVAVFDQMRGDYPERWQELYGDGGFQKIKNRGTWYSNAYLPYACSATGPGHASISTGMLPRQHGIIENTWYDRSQAKNIYCATSERGYRRVPALPSFLNTKPGQVEMAMAPVQLLQETLGDELRNQRKEAKVFSLALKDRAAVLMGGKNPSGAYCFDSVEGAFHTSSYYRDSPHPWVEAFNRRNVADQWFGGQWDRLLDAKLYDKYAGPDNQTGEGTGQHGQGITFPHPFGRPIPAPGKNYYDAVECSPFGNEIVWEFAKTCIEAEQLGQRADPDLLYLGFSSNDLVGHAWGPDSHEVLDITLRTDRLIAQMIEYLDDTLGQDRYTLIITADHGVCPLPEVSAQLHAKAIRYDPRMDIEPLEVALREAYGPLDLPSRWVEKFNFPDLYLNQRLIQSLGLPPEEVRAFAAKWLRNRNDFASVWTREELLDVTQDADIGLALHQAYHPERSGDLVLVGYPYSQPLSGFSNGTSHGSPYDYDRHVPILVYGARVPKLSRQEMKSSSLLVGPIVCESLGMIAPNRIAESLPSNWQEER